MTLYMVDLLWNIPILFFGIGAYWAMWRNRKPTSWHLWPWYAGASGVWGVNIVLEFLTNDPLWAWISAGLFLAYAVFAIIWFYEDKWERDLDRRCREAVERFEKFRIDN